jgi:hypothetical protein
MTAQANSAYFQSFVCYGKSYQKSSIKILANRLLQITQEGLEGRGGEYANNTMTSFIESSKALFPGGEGGCKLHGFTLKELPAGESELINESPGHRYWLIHNKGTGGVSTIGVAELYK